MKISLDIKTRWIVSKYKSGSKKPYEKVIADGNLVVLGGMEFLLNTLRYSSENFASPFVSIIVGDGCGLTDPTDSSLHGSNTFEKELHYQWYSVYNKSNIVYGILHFLSIFEESDANFDWNEVGLYKATGYGSFLINRKTFTFGTKTDGEIWHCFLMLIFVSDGNVP